MKYHLVTGDQHTPTYVIDPSDDELLYAFVKHAHPVHQNWPDEDRLAFCRTLQAKVTRRERGRPRRDADTIRLVARHLADSGLTTAEIEARLTVGFGLTRRNVREHYDPSGHTRLARAQGTTMKYPCIVTDDELDDLVAYDPRLVAAVPAYRMRTFTTRDLGEGFRALKASAALGGPLPTPNED